jgi:hypothetical protein
MSHIAQKHYDFPALFVLAVLGAVLPAGFASAAVLECPASAPPAWKVGKARLDQARVLRHPANEKLDERALPEGRPDREWQQGFVLYQSWDMKAGAPRKVAKVDCLYARTRRVLRLDARSAEVCVAKWNWKGDKLVRGSLVFRCS